MKSVGSLRGLLCSPLVLVCAGHESFRPPAVKNYRRNQSETLSELTSRNKNGSWGLKAKQSIIHSRSKSGDRSWRFSLMSQRSGLSDSSMSTHYTWMDSVLHRNPQDTPVHLGPLVTDDDFEKKIHMNEDGSLSVEMKVHFHMLSEDTLLWSKRVIRASTLTTASGRCPSPREVDPLHCVCEDIPGCFSEPGTLGLRPCASGGNTSSGETMTSQKEHTQEGSSNCPALSSSPLRNGDLQAEANGQDTGSHKARGRSVMRLPVSLGHSGSWDAEGNSPPLFSCASAQRRRRKQKSQVSTTSLPITPGFNSADQRKCHRKHHYQRDIHSPLDSNVRKQTSKDPGFPSSGSLHSQYPPAVSSATITPVSHSDPQKTGCAAHFYHPHFTSAETEGNPELGVSSPAPTASNISDSFSSQVSVDHVGAKWKRVREIRGMSQEKTSREGEILEEQEENGGMMPNALPHMSPEAVICEWLSHISEEPILMKYEMMNASPNVAGSGPEGTQEDLVDNHSLESLRELAQAIEPTLEGDISERPELDGAPVTDDASLKLEEAFSQRRASGRVSGAGKEVRASNRITVGHAVSKGVLLSRIPACRQIRRAVISPTQGQPSSLTEVSDVVGRRLSHSARVLVTCLTRLHFFNEDLGSSVSKVKFTDSPRFQELLATFQSLWPQCRELDSSLQEFRTLQALPVTEDFTPTSSSGVDVSSGSGGSGEGRGTCLVDSTITPERVELPLKMVTNIISSQRPTSNMSELRNQPADLKNQPLNSLQASSNFRAWPCTTSQDEAEDSKEQMLSNCLEQLVENIMQEEGVPAEKIEQEIEKEEMQEDSSKEEEFPEEERVNEQELSENGEKTRSMDLDPDPIGVFKLLKKMAKAFMTHFASAMAAIRTRWGLQNNDLLDKMVAELEQDLAWHLQDSITKEMEKIQNRPGKKVPRPPCEALRWKTSLQTQQRRRRLQGLRNLSAFRESTGAHGLVSLTLEDKPSFSGTTGIQLGENAEGEEFCPCEACVRKKMIPIPLSDTRGTGNTPIKKAFDLQQILQTRKEGHTNEEAACGAPDKWGMGLLQEACWRTGTVQESNEVLETELVPGSGADEGGEDEGSQKLSRGEDPKLGETEGASYHGRDEDPTAQRTDRKTDTSVDSDLEKEEWAVHGVNEKEESMKQSSGNEAHLKGLASGRSDLGPEGEGDSAEATKKVQDTEEEGQTGKKEDSLTLKKGESQLSESSENKSPDQEQRSTPPSTPGGNTSHQRSAPQTDISSSISSLGNCSQVSQKGSKEEHSTGETGSIADEPKGVTHPERKVTGMDSESSTSEQEGAPLGPSTPGQVADENLDLEDRKIVRSLTFTKVVDKTDEFHRDDLDC
ncbi:PREDICTED: retinitis pigmentosa 1-like 1 protein [Chrysochloris asiatica]|uniref:Retinitis pigmentosa 1-like 1 protein n=1 Tax=Chrysochloris asiatica TaxID=185453 RepID=A0A9B0TN36_CHRAS|nr:PREDICTED: retinitis pigmentosa 1-like 1 protein [Chrysochloris asiatica]